MPPRRRTSVVLPLPDGPTIVRNSPSTMSRSIPCNAVKEPKRFTTFESRKTVEGIQPSLFCYAVDGSQACAGPGTGGGAGRADWSAPLRGVVDLDQPVIRRDDLIVDRARHLLLQRVPLDRVEFVLVEQREDIGVAHLRD